jgi:drug/metabolite transporter (DMT)-like permease
LTGADYARLVALGAIWGASFIFQRLVAPTLGPIVTAESRVLLAGLVLLAWFRFTGFDPQWRAHWKAYLAIGVNNSALPFGFYAFAAMHAPASLLALLNSSAPIFGALFGALWLGERFTLKRALGLAAGMAGVALVSRPDASYDTPLFGWAVAASIVACLCYGFTGTLMKRLAAGAPSRGVAVGSQLGAALVLLPLVPLSPPLATPSTFVLVNAAVLAVLCGAVAYVLYFRLIADVGATRALTVTYLVPAFGVLFAWVFLGETVSPTAIAGGVLILAGVLLVTRS